MPHLKVEYSDHFSEFDSHELLLQMNTALFATGLFAQAEDIKARARCVDQVVIGLAAQQQAFVYARLSILTGRSAAQKKLLSDCLLGVLRAFTGYRAAKLTLQLCVEIAEIDRDSYGKVVQQI